MEKHCIMELPVLTAEFGNIEDKQGNSYVTRSVLDMKGVDLKSGSPELIIVMLNPGKCEIRNNSVSYDSTLHRIKNVIGGKIQWIRIINLSDVRCPESKSFYELVEKLPPEHSIFSEVRALELDEYLKGCQNVYFACGTSKKANELLLLAKNSIESRKLRILNESDDYYHPLMRPNAVRGKWESQVLLALK